MSRLLRITFASDVHVPVEDKIVVKNWLNWCKDFDPDYVILGGDIIDCESVSSHGGNPKPPTLVEEMAAGNKFLDAVQTVNKRAKIIYLEGNHEDRLKRYLANNAPTLDGITTLPKELHLKERGIEWHEYGAVVEIGKLGFTHGTFHGVHFAQKHLQHYGCSLVVGHTHRLQSFVQGIVNNELRGVFGMPGMLDLSKVSYRKGPAGWGLGFGAIYIDQETGEFSVYPVLCNRGVVFWNGKRYG